MNKKSHKTNRMKVYSLIGKRPMTSKQLERIAMQRGVNVNYYEICRRMSELVRAGFVESSGRAECPILGSTCSLWVKV